MNHPAPGSPRLNRGGSPTNLKAVEQVVPDTGLSESELVELREIFDLLDLDKGGTISKEEIQSFMISLGMDASKSEITNMVQEIDFHGAEDIDFPTFVEAMSKKVSTTVPPDHLKWAFKKFERPNNPPGMILVRDLVTALTEHGDLAKRLTKDQANELINDIAPQLRMDDYFDYNNYVDVLYFS